MQPSHLFVLALVVVFLFMFAIGSLELSFPFFARIRFDNTCNKYLAIVQAQGGLNATDRSTLIQELETLGFTNISITAPTNLTWNSEAILKIEADYRFRALGGSFNMERQEVSKRAVYENKTRVMTLER